MSLLACGLNHQTAPLPLREKVVFSTELMPEPLLDLVGQGWVNEAAILSTCNRTEIYCVSNEAVSSSIVDWLHRRQRLSAGQLIPHLYFYYDQAAVRHLLRVASGLDSMVLGEPQILGQVKNAFSLAQAAGTLGCELQRLFQYVFSASKKIRTQTAIGVHPVSIGYVAVNLAKQIFADLSKLSVLLIGVGETITLTARHLQAAGVKHFYVANRTLTRAEQLASQLCGESITLSAIAEYLPRVDMVVTATASTLPVVGKGTVERALKIRKRRPMFMIDLAVPRDIEPEVAGLDDVFLYTLDDLQTVIQHNQAYRQDAAQAAETLIDTQAARYMHSLKTLAATPVINAYRAKAEQLCEIELSKALRLLQTGIAPQEALQRLAQGLMNKLLHEPTVQLRKAATQEQEELLAAAQQLFGLQDE